VGRYDEALDAARNACADPHELVVHNWGLTELIEAAVRTGRTDVASGAFQRLRSKALASGTDWALGMEARARALMSDGDTAEAAHRDAIGYLARARMRAELARAHLLHGEWLAQNDRRPDARTELGVGYELCTGMGLEGFADRARRGLLATGATVSSPSREKRGELTAQEAQIAHLAAEGMSNPEIGARLFISARTVEWHLRKVFAKLGVTSRSELHRALQRSGRPS
jgi:DNA-binding CsgD family transcriptional regulator